MIYKSKAKVESIINNYEKKVSDRISVKEVNLDDYARITVKPKSNIQKVLSILKKEKKYKDEFGNNVLVGYYYAIQGNMSYLGYEAGNYRKFADSKFVNSLNDKTFFSDDYLLFNIALDTNIENWRKIIVKCKAENVECFSSQEIFNNIVFSKNTSDPGVLERMISICGVVRLDVIDKERKICYGNPLYLKTDYD